MDCKKLTKHEFDKYLYETYPQLFTDTEPRMPFPMFGVECSSGWYEIIDNLLNKIKDSGFKIHQIKEKYGTLRVYTDFYKKDVEDLIDEAEELSAITCEMCGKPGVLRANGGWWYTSCEDCVTK